MNCKATKTVRLDKAQLMILIEQINWVLKPLQCTLTSRFNTAE